MIKNSLPHLSCAAFLLLGLLCGVGNAQSSATPESFLKETDALLEAVRADILADLKAREQAELRDSERQAGKASAQAVGRSGAEVQERAAIEAQRMKLLSKVTRWSREDVTYLDQLSASELNQAMTSARTIAAYFGLDVERLGKLYELGKKTIRSSQFVTPDRIPPDQDESYSRYFKELFVFAHSREKELAEFRRKSQEYRLRLFKKVTLAYMRALLSAGEPLPKCDVETPASPVAVAGVKVSALRCPDPVVYNLRSYVKAVQQIAAAESDTFAAEAERVLAQQTLVADIAAGIPLVGDALDFYSLYSGEDLAGKCLSRFSYGITVVFSAIPFVPASWMDQVLKRAGDVTASAAATIKDTGAGLLSRVPGIEQGITRLLVLSKDYAEWGAELTATMASRVGVTPERLDKAMNSLSALLSTEINVTRQGLQIKPGHVADGRLTSSSAATINRELAAGEIVYDNLKLAEEGQVIFRNLPRQLQERMQYTSRRIMNANLDALQRGRGSVVGASNMLPEHLDAFEKLARSDDAILAFRAVNGDATNLIRANYATKWMDVKPKSADWGPHKGFLPFEQNFSKIMGPEKLKNASPEQLAEAAQKAAKYSAMAEECIVKPNCFKVDLVLPDGNSVHIWRNGDADIPIMRNKQGEFIDPDSRRVLSVEEGSTRPMEVMAGKNADGEIVPLTADYDLLAMGTKSDARAPKFSDETGYITAEEEALVGKINTAGKEAGYSGGNLSHHGPENQFYKSPGALAEDPVITIVDPQKGLITVPRCDADCMARWCRTSAQCGSIPICVAGKASPPCIAIDPDRLLKDYFHDARLRGYTNLRPNSVWGWGEVNGLSGWTPKVLLDNTATDVKAWRFGQYRPGWGVKDTLAKEAGKHAQRIRRSALQATKYLFSCPEESQ